MEEGTQYKGIETTSMRIHRQGKGNAQTQQGGSKMGRGYTQQLGELQTVARMTQKSRRLLRG